jgi:hypothetical protein
LLLLCTTVSTLLLLALLSFSASGSFNKHGTLSTEFSFENAIVLSNTERELGI